MVSAVPNWMGEGQDLGLMKPMGVEGEYWEVMEEWSEATDARRPFFAVRVNMLFWEGEERRIWWATVVGWKASRRIGS